MKPTGVTKEATGHSPLPWKLTEEGAGCAICAKNNVDSYGIRDAKDQLVCLSEHDSFAPGRSDCEFIITAVNERERLREVLRLATQINVYGDPVNLAAKEAADAALNEFYLYCQQ